MEMSLSSFKASENVCVCVCVFRIVWPVFLRTDSRLKGQRAKGQRQLVAQTTAGKSADQQKRKGGRQKER